MRTDFGPHHPYVICETGEKDKIMIINMRHSHESQIESEQGLMKYFRHCVYDAAAEWQAQQHRARMDPDTIKMLKDCLLRVPFQIEQHATARDAEPLE